MLLYYIAVHYTVAGLRLRRGAPEAVVDVDVRAVELRLLMDSSGLIIWIISEPII